jgi:hypothetical protein
LRIPEVILVCVGPKHTRHATDIETEKPTTNGRKGTNGVNVVHPWYHGEVVSVLVVSKKEKPDEKSRKAERSVLYVTYPEVKAL